MCELFTTLYLIHYTATVKWLNKAPLQICTKMSLATIWLGFTYTVHVNPDTLHLKTLEQWYRKIWILEIKMTKTCVNCTGFVSIYLYRAFFCCSVIQYTVAVFTPRVQILSTSDNRSDSSQRFIDYIWCETKFVFYWNQLFYPKIGGACHISHNYSDSSQLDIMGLYPL